MKHNRTLRAVRCPAFQVGYLAISLALCLYFFGCDDDPPTGPVDPVEKDYIVWITPYDSNIMYRYHTLTGKVDTLSLVRQARGADATVSHDGKLLYVPDEWTVEVYETDSLSLVTVLPYHAKYPVVCSPDGQCIAIIGDSTTTILNTADYSEAFQEPRRLPGMQFSSDSRSLYVTYSDTIDYWIGVVRKTDTGWTVLYGQFPGAYGTAKVIPTPDESKLLLYLGVGSCASVFAVYDVALDSIIAIDYQSPGGGLPTMTPDGRYAYYGNPGSILVCQAPPSEFTEFDIVANRIVKRVSTKYFIDGATPNYMPIGYIAITPDGRWLVGMEGGASSGSLLKYDLVNDTLVDYVDLNDLTYGISVQLVP